MCLHFVFGDGTVFCGQWLDTPQHRDVQVVIFQDPANNDTWTVRHGGQGGSECDFFREDDDGSVVGMDLAGMIDFVVNDLGIVKQGKMLSSKQWGERLHQAMKLRDELRRGYEWV